MRPQIVVDAPDATGPIRTATQIEATAALDRAGRIAFNMPAGDPKAAQIAEKREAGIYGLVAGARAAIGLGIIDRVRVDVAAERLEVAGDNLLRELTYNLVDGLELWEDVTVTPPYAEENETDVGHTPLPEAVDDNTGTFDTINLVIAPNLKYLYVGHTTTFDRVILNLGTQVNNNAATLLAQYYNGRGWQSITISDGTAVAGATLAQDGTISFTRPDDWTEVENSSQSLFWLRLYPSADLDAVDVVEIDVRARTPTKAGPQMIMALAPAGWSLNTGDWYDETAADVYHTFDDNTTVLAALVELAQLTGEHFRLGDGREIQWLQNDQPDSGLRAVRAAPGVEANDDVVVILEAERVVDSYEVYNRIYPYGAGLGAARLTLAGTTESAPTGYTLDATNNYIEKNSATPRISRSVSFQEIRAVDPSATGDTHAPDQLFRAALAELQRYDAAQQFYKLRVTKLPKLLKPGETIHVVYRRVVGAYVAISVNATLVILEVAHRIDESGALSAELQVGTVARYPASDTSTLTHQMQAGARLRGSVQRAAANAVAGALNHYRLLKA